MNEANEETKKEKFLKILKCSKNQQKKMKFELKCRLSFADVCRKPLEVFTEMSGGRENVFYNDD